MKNVYMTFAIVGAVAPYIFFTTFLMDDGFTIVDFVKQLFATAPASGFTVDLLITSFVFWLWSFHEAQNHRIRHWWAFVAINLAIGLSCAFPLFLYFRTAAMERQQ